MFRRLRLSYLALLLLAALIVLTSAVVGRQPLLYYLASSWRRMIVLWLLPPLLWCCWLGFLVVRRRVRRPSAAIWRLVRRDRAWIARGALFVALLGPVARAFSAFKGAIPKVVPFYLDPVLARIDRLLFLGTPPWQITHAIIGPFGTMLIDRLYVLWFPVMMGLLAWLCFTRDQALQVRGLLTYALTCFLFGNIPALGLSSVGPCFYRLFYHSGEFDPLMASLRVIDTRYALFSFREMDWLYAQGATGTLGSGISAMPSIHIAIAFLVFLVVRERYARPAIRAFALAYAVTIWIGSVHLGWHYFTDGLVSVVGVSTIWWGMGRFVEWIDRREKGAVNASTGPAIPVPG